MSSVNESVLFRQLLATAKLVLAHTQNCFFFYTTFGSFDDCSKLESDEEKQGLCVQNHFVKYNALASRLFTSSNTIKEEYRVIVMATKMFGEISKTPCMALGACTTDVMEKYIKLFMSNGRESAMHIVYPDSETEESAEGAESAKKDEYKLKPPGSLNYKDVFGEDLSSFFSVQFQHLSNPLMALMKPAIDDKTAFAGIQAALKEEEAVSAKL